MGDSADTAREKLARRRKPKPRERETDRPSDRPRKSQGPTYKITGPKEEVPGKAAKTAAANTTIFIPPALTAGEQRRGKKRGPGIGTDADIDAAFALAQQRRGAQLGVRDPRLQPPTDVSGAPTTAHLEIRNGKGVWVGGEKEPAWIDKQTARLMGAGAGIGARTSEAASGVASAITDLPNVISGKESPQEAYSRQKVQAQGLGSTQDLRQGIDTVSLAAGNLVGGLANAAIGFIPGTVQFARDPEGSIKMMADAYKYQYGSGDLHTTLWRMFVENPAQTFLDLQALATGGAGTARVLGKIKRRENLFARQRTTPEYVQTSAGPVRRQVSRAPVYRAAQRKFAGWQAKRPGAPLVGADARGGRLLRTEAEIEMERQLAPVDAFAELAHKNARSMRRKVAYDHLARYGDQAVEALPLEIAMREKAGGNPNRMQAMMLDRARNLITNPDKKMTELLDAGRNLSKWAEDIFVDHGLLSRETAAERVDLPWISIQESLPIQSMRRAEIRQDLSTLPELQDPYALDAAMTVLDTTARNWARRTGNPEADFYEMVERPKTLGEKQQPSESVLMQQGHGPDAEVRAGVAERAGLESLDQEAPHANRDIDTNAIAAKLDKSYPRAGRPEGARTSRQMRDLVARTLRYTLDGASGWLWYENAGADILRATHGRPLEEARRVASAFAYLSRANGVKSNTSAALRAYTEWSRGEKVSGTGMRFPNVDAAKVQKILDGEEWNGQKTNSFYRNFYEDIDPEGYRAEFGDTDPVTVDRWIFRIMFGKDSGTVAQYAFAREMTQEITKALGWGRSKRTQAAMWVSFKGEEEAAGKLATLVSQAKKKGKPLTEEEQAAALEKLMGEHTQAAGRQFGDYAVAPEYAVRANIEGNNWPGFKELSPEGQRAYVEAVTGDIAQYYRDAGAAAYQGDTGVGAWRNAEGDVVHNPAGGVDISIGGVPTVSVADDIPLSTLLSDTDRAWLNGLVSEAARASNEDGAAWVRLIPINNRGNVTNHATAATVRLGRQATPDELATLNDRLGEAARAAGLVDEGGDSVLLAIHSNDGVTIIETTEGSTARAVFDRAPGTELATIYRDAIREALPDAEVPVMWGHAGEYIPRSGYRLAVANSGRARQIRGAGKHLRAAIQARRVEHAGRAERGQASPEVLAQEGRTQATRTEPRAAVRFNEDGTATPLVTPRTDVSSVAHEAAHIVRRLVWDTIDEKTKRTIERELGVEDGNWNTAHEEAFARAMEVMWHSGKTPIVPPLRSALRNVKAQMKEVYTSTSHIDKELNENIREPNSELSRALRSLLHPMYGEKTGEGAFFMSDSSRPTLVSGLRRAAYPGSKSRLRFQRDEGINFESGRIKRGPKNTATHALQGAKLRNRTNNMKLIAERWAKDIDADGLDEGYVLFNPKGYKVSPQLHSGKEWEQDFLNLGPDEVDAALAERLKHMEEQYFPGQVTEYKGLKQVPKWVKEAYVQEEAINLGRGPLLKAWDMGNNLMRLGLIYLSPAYVPVNLGANELLAIIHQGVWHPVNLIRALGGMSDLTLRTRHRLDREVGGGTATGLLGDTQGRLGAATSAVAHGLSFAADRIPRRTAIIHELWKEGFRTDKEINALLDDTTPARRDLLNQIAQRAEESMVKFRGLSKTEREVISRGIFVYRWVKGATRYATQYPLEHPIQAPFTYQLGEQGQDWLEEKMGEVGSFFKTKYPVGKKDKDAVGNILQKVIDVGSVSPFVTGADAYQAIIGTLTGHDIGVGSARVSDMFAPLLDISTQALTGRDNFGQEQTHNPLQIARGEFNQLRPARLVEGLINPPGESRYYKAETRKDVLGRFAAAGFWPRTLKLQEAQAQGLQELPTTKRWLKLMEQGKPGYSAADVSQRILEREAKRLYKYDKTAGNRFYAATAYWNAGDSYDIHTREDVDAELENSDYEPMTDSEWDKVQEIVAHAKSVVSGG